MTMPLHSRRLTAGALLALAAGCTGSAPSEPGAALAAESEAPIQTDRDAYSIQRSANFAEVSIPFRYRNRTGQRVYVPSCHGAYPPALEKRVDGAWVRAYSPVVLLCLGEPVMIRPGETYSGALRVVAGLPGNNYYPKFDVTPVAGTYRLAWIAYTTWTPNGRDSGHSRILPLEWRVSNEFRIDDPPQ